MKIILFKSTDFSVQMRQLNFNLIKWSIPVNISWILENHSQVPSSLIIQSEILREGLRTEQFKSTLNKISKKGPTNSGGTSMLNLYLRAGYDKIGLDLTLPPPILDSPDGHWGRAPAVTSANRNNQKILF